MIQRTIWKFPLKIVDDYFLVVPKGANVLSVGWDPKLRTPALWAEVDPGQEHLPLHVWVVATGRDLPESRGRFVGTSIDLELGLVYHIYVGDPG